MLSGDNGILQRATDAKTKSDEAQIRERIQLAYHSALTKDITGENGELTMPTLQEELNNEFIGKTVTITPNADKKEWTIKVDNVEETVPAGKDDTPQVATLPSAEGTTPYFPGDSFSQVDGTDLSTGLVITDELDENRNSIGNEYVWIEVPSTYVDASITTGPDYSQVSGEDDYAHIATALRKYCTVDLKGNLLIATSGTDPKTSTNGCKDEWYNGCGIIDSGAYISLYNKMLKSVYKNGGFWIGRYEAGTSIVRGNKTDSIDSLIPSSKQDLYPMNYVTCSQAQTMTSKINNIENYNCSLMFGVQWDLMLRYLSNKGIETSLLTSNSSTWGNYYNQQFEINRGKYSITTPWNVYTSYTTETSNKVTIEENVSTKIGTTSTNKILLTTGSSDANSKQNIYDLAGNLLEMTLEHSTSTSTAPLCYRGGNFFTSGNNAPVSNRSDAGADNAIATLGFRVCIY